MSRTTMMLDPGLPTSLFTDVVASHGQFVDLVKFGWGTALVTGDLDRKIAVLREAGIGFYFGGTLFEHYLWRGRLEEFLTLVDSTGATHIEVSNGSIPLGQSEKAGYVRMMTRYRPVLSEVGYKDAERSARLKPGDWVEAIHQDLDAGAELVITETRESGRSGMARPDGQLRDDVLAAVLAAVAPERLLFEAPTKPLQVGLIRALGPSVNLGNIAPSDVLAVETLRRGLRGDTLLHLVPAAGELPLPRTISVA
ncbi:phosphosulfolactate synthase [Amycolatopsis rhizosphaerae]|uniref:Phosphosulfolactate synthase n=1 Tax=Amycolatopsis rhizosphaerae TaxID=2053003 RepID=A0A558BNH0_9PSEU|nr:phosphosulfolactate synthase [Amycolatopsis rhizosphaerae]TVT38056.1 phosphosulfolactate synthase [Amycolatopsis rhizosphaerae]